MISKSLKFIDQNGNDLYLAFDLAFECMEKSHRANGLTSIMMPNGRQYLVTDDPETVKKRFDEAAQANEA